ncbi:MAG: hypothetical protein AUJ47_07450 [Candidatus Marinimicrobia bacterium CG1_02_48_14]|nr:MAG: hypothetical protein AUJ47_07450 [Candidatus Marinimicrobia bacterium CG1_02_48_14]
MTWRELRIEKMRGLLWGIIAVVSFALLGFLSSVYAERMETDQVERVTIYGNRILSTERLQSILKPYMLQRLEAINPDSVQAQFTRHPLVKTAKVSRIYPNELQVRIREVYPIAYLQGNTYFSIDADGRILPLPDYGMIYTLPIITGIENPDALETEKIVTDAYTLNMLQLLIRLRQQYPHIYQDISEMNYTDEQGLKLITSSNSTPVLLGIYNQINQSCATLDAFINQLGFGSVLPAYRYVDLRFANQVVVRERK